MFISEETKDKLNELLTESFLLNMKLDNIVYQIDFEAYVNIAPIVHESFAHLPPQWADNISDFMIKMDTKPIRGNLEAEYIEYNGELSRIFADIASEMEGYRKKILEVIEISELNEDTESKLFFEEFLLMIIPYYKQARVWGKYAQRYANDYKSLDVHFKDITTYIDIAK